MNPKDTTGGGIWSRREMLGRAGTGMGLLALGAMAPPASAASGSLAPKAPHHRPRAKRIIHIFLNGGPSQVDTFDPKPRLQAFHGKTAPIHLKTERKTGMAFGSPFAFKRYGESGLPISELFAEVGAHADALCVVRSMQSDLPNHGPATLLMNCGSPLQIRPSLGAWVTYGLGCETQNLPAFVALCPNGMPDLGPNNWRASFLPGACQGAYVETRHRDVRKLVENVRNPVLGDAAQRRQLDALRALNAAHLAQRPGESELEARIHGFELAYRMQSAASDAFDVSKESHRTREAYGEHPQGRQLLMARRLVERGVRFVQVWHGPGNPWDAHAELEKNHRRLARQCSRPIAALLGDLKERGLLEDTLVICGGEFGRTPTVELPNGQPNNMGKMNGRDHNHHGFAVWMAGGGVRGGTAYGQTDELGFAAVKDRMHVHDLHATILHLMGFDHERLTYRFSGRDFRLTDVHGDVAHGVIA